MADAVTSDATNVATKGSIQNLHMQRITSLLEPVHKDFQLTLPINVLTNGGESSIQLDVMILTKQRLIDGAARAAKWAKDNPRSNVMSSYVNRAKLLRQAFANPEAMPHGRTLQANIRVNRSDLDWTAQDENEIDFV